MWSEKMVTNVSEEHSASILGAEAVFFQVAYLCALQQFCIAMQYSSDKTCFSKKNHCTYSIICCLYTKAAHSKNPPTSIVCHIPEDHILHNDQCGQPYVKLKTWNLKTIVCFFYVYQTAHHLDSWVKRDQLDVTCFIISLFNAQHVSDSNTSILKSLRLICWVISWVVLLWFDVCWCYVVVWLWWCGIHMQAEALASYPLGSMRQNNWSMKLTA